MRSVVAIVTLVSRGRLFEAAANLAASIGGGNAECQTAASLENGIRGRQALIRLILLRVFLGLRL